MRILAVGDLHGDLGVVDRAIDRFDPDALLCVGDWGDANQLIETELARVVARLPTLTIFGNHDPLGWLGRVIDRDSQSILIEPGTVRSLGGLKIAGISGIWAKSHRQPYYVTDEDVAEQATRIAASGPIEILLTHGCPIGLADQTPSGKRGGQRCFLLANQVINPTIHLCGHLHQAQERTLRDGRRVLNVGPTPEGSIVLVDLIDNRPVAQMAQIEEQLP